MSRINPRDSPLEEALRLRARIAELEGEIIRKGGSAVERDRQSAEALRESELQYKRNCDGFAQM